MDDSITDKLCTDLLNLVPERKLGEAENILLRILSIVHQDTITACNKSIEYQVKKQVEEIQERSFYGN